jgi:phage baseplate assembly protein W
MARRIRQILSINTNDAIRPMNTAVGIKLPFSGKTGNLFDLSYTTEEQAISNLKNLLLTRKGERYMQPSFGTDIYDSLFEQNTEDLPNILRDGISADIAFWLPYIIINELTVSQNSKYESEPIGHILQISLTVQVTENGASTPITITVTPSTITVE